MDRFDNPGKWRSIARAVLLLLAVALGATFLTTGLVLFCAPQQRQVADADSTPLVSAADSVSWVGAQMRNVRYQVDRDIVMQIDYLDGSLRPLKDSLPVFDQPGSFRLRVRSAEIMLDTVSLSNLLNRYVFGYRGSPIRDLHISVEDGHLKQRGKLGTLSFTILATMQLTREGWIRLHPVDVKVLGINADGLMDKLGIELDELVKVREGGGVRIEENDFLLDPVAIVPPPRLEGRVTAVRLTSAAVVLQFGTPDSLPPRRYFGGKTGAENYMSFVGARLRFGKLTMTATDMVIVDADPGDPFDFSLKDYHAQLVAGLHRTTPSDGLVVIMPDAGEVKSISNTP